MKFNISRSELSKLIDEWIFSERDRKLLKRRLLDGVCYEPLAEEFDLSTTRVKVIVCEGTKKIREHMKSE